MGEAAATATYNLHLHSGAILNVVQIQEATTFQYSTKHFHSLRPHHQDTSMASRLAIFALIVTAFVNFLQLKYQGKPESPFETRPLTMLVAVVSLLVYCLSYDGKLRFSSTFDHDTNYNKSSLTARFVHVSMAIFGPLSLAAMASVLFPKISCLLLFPGAMLYSLMWQVLVLQLPGGIRKAWDWLLVAIKNRFCNQEFRQGSRRRAASGRINSAVPRLSLSELAIIDQVEMGSIRLPV